MHLSAMGLWQLLPQQAIKYALVEAINYFFCAYPKKNCSLTFPVADIQKGKSVDLC